MTQKTAATNQFDELVTNALDFLKKSVDEIDSSPKNTIIDFYTAVELFIKARLMKEHWSLIITRQESSTLTNFKKGDFQSVSLKDARERLKNIVDDDIGDEAYDCFREIGNHRNRLVHFHNKSVDLREVVVKDVLKGLYFLDLLLNNRWREHFTKYESEILEVSGHAHTLRDFLKAKYNVLKSGIDASELAGIDYNKCLSCGFNSAEKTALYEFIYGSHCKVCDFEEHCVRIHCPSCNEINYVSHGYGNCDSCNKMIEVISNLKQLYPDFPSSKEGLIESQEYPVAFCNQITCTSQPTVFQADSNWDTWFCVNCNGLYDDVEDCMRCGQLIAGDSDTSLGCLACRDSLFSND